MKFFFSYDVLDQLQSDIQNEKTISTELDVQIREWEKKIRQKQTEVGGAHAAVNFNANVQKQGRVLENRLDTVSEYLYEWAIQGRFGFLGIKTL